MEPSLAAAAHSAKTTLEGLTAGALAIANPTVPLKARFYHLPSPSPSLKRSSHTLNVIKGRAYIFGGDGDVVGSDGDTAMHVLTLPSDLSLRDSDYQRIPAVGGKKKKEKGDSKLTEEVDDDNDNDNRSREITESVGGSGGSIPAARAGHTASVIGDRIYVFGGSSPTGKSDPTAAPTAPLKEDGRVYAFDTVTKTWEVLVPNTEAGGDGVPAPRNYASSCSSEHPRPIRREEAVGQREDDLMTDEARLRLLSRRQGEAITATDDQDGSYGTLFVHGGYDSEWNLLRDVWAFDIEDRIWTRWPDVPGSEVDGGEGKICCIESRLWRCGDGFGKIAHLDIVRNQFDDISGKGELSIGPKSGEWEVHAFGVKPGDEKLEVEVEKKMGGKPSNTASLFPSRRKRSGFVPVTTGQGREYLLLFMGETGPQELLDDLWSFQIPSEKKSAAAFKDKVKALIGKETGLEHWAKADILESNREDGVLDFPKGLSRFGSDSGGDLGGIVIWGGIGPGGESENGWMLMLE